MCLSKHFCVLHDSTSILSVLIGIRIRGAHILTGKKIQQICNPMLPERCFRYCKEWINLFLIQHSIFNIFRLNLTLILQVNVQITCKSFADRKKHFNDLFWNMLKSWIFCKYSILDKKLFQNPNLRYLKCVVLFMSSFQVIFIFNQVGKIILHVSDLIPLFFWFPLDFNSK